MADRQAYRRLGAAVLAQAWSDALVRQDSDWREPVLFFEHGGPSFRFWCGLADLDPESVQQRFRRARETRVNTARGHRRDSRMIQSLRKERA